MKALNEYILVKEIQQPESNSNGLIIPSTSKPKMTIGEVITVGEKVTGVNSGDKIIFNSLAGVSLNVEEKEYIIVEQKNVFLNLTAES